MQRRFSAHRRKSVSFDLYRLLLLFPFHSTLNPVRALDAAQVEEAGERVTAKECMICYNDECRGSDGICCVGGHYFCSSCYDRTIGDEQDRINGTRVLLDDHRAREGKMRCPQSGDGCSELLSDYELAQALSDERFSEYARVRDETHAARVRVIEVG